VKVFGAEEHWDHHVIDGMEEVGRISTGGDDYSRVDVVHVADWNIIRVVR